VVLPFGATVHACSHASAGKDCPDSSGCAEYGNDARLPDVTPHRTTQADSYLSRRLLTQRGRLPRCGRAADTARLLRTLQTRASNAMLDHIRQNVFCQTSFVSPAQASHLSLTSAGCQRWALDAHDNTHSSHNTLRHPKHIQARAGPGATSDKCAAHARWTPRSQANALRTRGQITPRSQAMCCARTHGGRPAHTRRPCSQAEALRGPRADGHAGGGHAQHAKDGDQLRVDVAAVGLLHHAGVACRARPPMVTRVTAHARRRRAGYL